MMERIEKMFAAMMKKEGFADWWATESRWEEWENKMIENGLDKQMVSDFFRELEQDI